MPDSALPLIEGPPVRRQLASTQFAAPAYALIALAATTLFVLTIAISGWVYFAYPPAVDFVAFWAAGRLTLGGHPAAAYDIHLHRAVEATVTHFGGLMPFPYPPPFLFVVSAFAWPPYWLSYLLWILATSALYLAATMRLMPPRFAFAHPAAIVNAIIGQNGFLTSGIFIFGITAVATRPFTAGLVLGLLVIKPQLGVLIPVALLAGREWRAIGGAALSAAALLAAAALVFGIDSYVGFLAISHQFVAFMAGNRWNWAQQASVLSLFRFLGAPQPVAFAAQAIAAAIAAAFTWRAWALRDDNRTAIVAAATLLVPPYVLTYDSLLLILPLACLVRDHRRPWRPAIIWLCLVLPLLGDFNLCPGLNTIPFAAILSVWWLAGNSFQRIGTKRQPESYASC